MARLMALARIPIFPLNIVLFPGQVAPLHIFEPRYRQMTRECVEGKSPFGIVFVNEGKMARTGCSAMIVKTLKGYPDGRSDILVAGDAAFRLIETYEEKPYIEADIEYLEEESAVTDREVTARLEKLFNECHQVLYAEDGPRFEAESGVSLAYHVASELPLDLEFRQKLLEERSEAERQRQLITRLAEWYPQLQERDRVRAKSAGNGHGKL